MHIRTLFWMNISIYSFILDYEIVKKLLDNTRVDKKAMNKEGFTGTKIIASKMVLTDFKIFLL